MTLLVFIYVYRIGMNKEQLMPCSNKHNLHLKNILSSVRKKVQGKKYFQVKQTKHAKLLLQVQCPGQSDLQLPIFKLFYVDAIN